MLYQWHRSMPVLPITGVTGTPSTGIQAPKDYLCSGLYAVLIA